MSAQKSVLVFGSAGAMGRAVFKSFQQKGWNVVGVDLASVAANPNAAEYVTLPLEAQPGNAGAELKALIDDIANKSKVSSFNAVVNAAGGWAGGGAAATDIAVASELMWNQSVKSSIACAHVATTLGSKDEGVLLVLTGAAATTAGTPGMLAYGTAKAAVDHITRSVSEELASINPLSAALEIAPVTIDTPGNRGGMPDADFSNWTSCEEISGKIVEWAAAGSSDSRPKNGSIMKVETKGGKSSWSPLF